MMMPHAHHARVMAADRSICGGENVGGTHATLFRTRLLFATVTRIHETHRSMQLLELTMFNDYASECVHTA